MTIAASGMAIIPLVKDPSSNRDILSRILTTFMADPGAQEAIAGYLKNLFNSSIS